MPEAITRMQVDLALGRMGYALVRADGGFVAYLDRNYPGDPAHYLLLNFSGGRIWWDDIRRALEYDGASISVFLAELESL